MNKQEMNEEYFRWLCGFVGCHHHRELLRYLHSVPFTYIIPNDGNRYEDGVNLRYRYADEKCYHYKYISAWLDDRECSVLEMMVALSLRIEEQITSDPEAGDRTSNWFISMLKSLHLWDMTDDNFDMFYVTGAVRRFLNRDYNSNGNGGLFTIKKRHKDLRKAEIWYQAMWYLDECI